MWAADAGNSLIRRLTPSTRAVSILTGSRSNPGRDDGTGAAARFFLPREMTIDGQGNLVVADRPNQTIRRISLATGLTTTWVGMAGQPGSADGIGAAARFRGPTVVTYDGSGVIYVADTVNNTIRRILVATGEVSTLAGKAGETRSDDGIGAAAGFFQPNGLAYDGAGVLYVADTFNNTIRRIRVATGEVTTLAGAVGPPDCVDGIGTAARFRFPATLAYDGQGSLYVSSGCHAIHRITVSTGEVTTVAGVRARGYDDGIGLAARFNEPLGIALDQSGHLYVADSLNNAIRCVTLSTGQVRTVLGKAGPGAVITGPLAQSLLYRPFGLESISPGVLAISVSSDNAILITRGLGCGP